MLILTGLRGSSLPQLSVRQTRRFWSPSHSWQTCTSRPQVMKPDAVYIWVCVFRGALRALVVQKETKRTTACFAVQLFKNILGLHPTNITFVGGYQEDHSRLAGTPCVRCDVRGRVRILEVSRWDLCKTACFQTFTSSMPVATSLPVRAMTTLSSMPPHVQTLRARTKAGVGAILQE